MTQREFWDYVKRNDIGLQAYNIVVGTKSNEPYTVGCYEGLEHWMLYEVANDGTSTVFFTGTEEEVFRMLYGILRRRMNG